MGYCGDSVDWTYWALPEPPVPVGLSDPLADLVIARQHNNTNSWDDFYNGSPDDLLLIISRGNIVLFDPSLKETLTKAGLIGNNFHQAGPNGKYVPGDISGLMKEIRSYYPAVQFPHQTSG